MDSHGTRSTFSYGTDGDGVLAVSAPGTDILAEYSMLGHIAVDVYGYRKWHVARYDCSLFSLKP